MPVCILESTYTIDSPSGRTCKAAIGSHPAGKMLYDNAFICGSHFQELRSDGLWRKRYSETQKFGRLLLDSLFSINSACHSVYKIDPRNL